MRTATLNLFRTRGGIDSRDWQIIIDGDAAGSVAPHQTAVLPVTPGDHTLRLRSSRRRRSRERHFHVGDGQSVTFRCHATLFWPTMLATLARPELWIALHQV